MSVNFILKNYFSVHFYTDVSLRRCKYIIILILYVINFLLILHKKRKLENHETRELISVKREKLDFEVVDERIEPKPEKLILMIKPEPPSQVHKNEPPCIRKKRKGEGHEIWLDKWLCKPKIIKSLTEDSFAKEPP